jgi:carbonic anhydrase/acetyltransferase-like protein (isoleucine patch superfamily)
MSVFEFEATRPQIASSAYVHETAVVIGDVSVGEDASVWPMAVVRGDIHRIRIGPRTNIQDGSILHVTHDSRFNPGGYPLVIGADVTLGHRVTLHGCILGDLCLIGMGATVMDGAVLHPHTMLAAGSLVPAGRELESGYLWRGSPARRARALSEEELAYLEYVAAHYVRLKDQYRAGI